MRNTKKGFTLVELLVVIAILAILATVSVVGYTSFIKRANVSNDQAMIGMINNNLQAAYVTGNPATAGDAITTLAGLGFYGDKFDAYTDGYHYAYNLTNNKFYLLDDEDNVVYPEECDKSQLWGLYDNNKYDLIDGVTKYVLLSVATDATQFNDPTLGFQSGTDYTIDLNDKVMCIEETPNANIKLINGFVLGTNASYFTIDSSVETLTTKTLEYQNDGKSHTNAYFDSTTSTTTVDFTKGDVVFDGCVFDIPHAFQIVGSNNVTFKNCTFISDNNGQWALTVGGTGNDAYKGTITIENCTFKSSRGININPMSVEYAPTIIIKNCEFATSNPDKAAIQFSKIGTASKETATVTTATITIEGNHFASKAAVIVHSTAPTDTSIYANVTFANNTLAEGVGKVIRDDDDDHNDVINALNAKFR